MSLMMKLVLHNEINRPVYLEIPIPDGVKNAIRLSKVTRCEFLFYQQGKEGNIAALPEFSAPTEINKLWLPNG
jgi:hypothetical protein